MSPESHKEWTESESIEFYNKLLNQALDSISESGASMVLGPMFILNTPEENFLLFEQAQDKLTQQGIQVFNQLPLLDYNLKDAPFKYDLKFEIFYKGLINSGKINSCYLLPNWRKSEGTKTEIQYCKDNNVPVIEL